MAPVAVTWEVFGGGENVVVLVRMGALDEGFNQGRYLFLLTFPFSNFLAPVCLLSLKTNCRGQNAGTIAVHDHCDSGLGAY